jgi:3-hydroxyacyl-CoA dehydrogenase
MYWADQIGLQKILDRLKAFEGAMGAQWRPAALLESLAAEGKGFKDLK